MEKKSQDSQIKRTCSPVTNKAVDLYMATEVLTLLIRAKHETLKDHNLSNITKMFPAQEGEKHHQNKRHMLLILGPTIALAILVLVSATWYLRERVQRGNFFQP